MYIQCHRRSCGCTVLCSF